MKNETMTRKGPRRPKRLKVLSVVFVALGLAASFSADARPPGKSKGQPQPRLSHLPAGQRLTARFGPEFTFTATGSSPSTEGADRMYAHAMRHLIDGQPEGAKFTTPSKYKLESPNGWWFEITMNPGVLEIKMSPLTVEETRRFADDIQDAVFASAANVGMFPWDYLGGGHLNFSTDIFQGDVLLARNFLADFWSHNELAMGILNYDTNNAVPFSLYKESDRNKVQAIMDAAGRGVYPDGEMGLNRFLTDINAVMRLGGGPASWNGSQSKHHDLNLYHAGRMEIRAVRPQANMHVWLNQIELIESRINYLRRFQTPIPLKPRVALKKNLHFDKSDFSSDSFHPPVDSFEALRSFHEYVTESGLSWENHRWYVWPSWQRSDAMRELEASPGFKKRERRMKERRRWEALRAARVAGPRDDSPQLRQEDRSCEALL